MAGNVRLRPEQHAIVHGYRGGKMGIKAVPGSGKTFTLSHLAAQLVEDLTSRGLTEGVNRREVLIVTFTNTAVNHFRNRIADILQRERGLLPYIGYRVRTLHGLAHDIVRERPGLVGLSEDFQIIDERVTTHIIEEIARGLLTDYLPVFRFYLSAEIAANEQRLRQMTRNDLSQLAIDLGQRFVKQAKNYRLEPAQIRGMLEPHADAFPLVRFGLAVYEDYQRSLTYRGGVDFDDLVRLAIDALERDEDYLARLRTRWPYILEDEAQDSSKLQEDMLRLLSGERNWVRVGDPNQAINTTFTTADPRFLRNFLSQRDVQDMPLQTSGRSTQAIIDLANTLVAWTTRAHPVPHLRQMAFLEQYIQPAPANDPAPNPPDDDSSIYIHYQPGENVSPDYELELVTANVERFLAQGGGQDYTVAVLAPENSHAYKLAERLKAREIDYEELLRSTSATRQAATILYHVLDYLGEPLNARTLATLYQQVWRQGPYGLPLDDRQIDIAFRALTACREPERFLWPLAGSDWLDDVRAIAQEPDIRDDLEAFRGRVRVWLEATTLPVDQLILTITQDCFTEPSDIALGYKIAVVLREMTLSNPAFRLPEFAAELQQISANERKFIGFDDVEKGYEPQKGKVTVATMHAAKGLEWDRVYLMGVSNYGFPAAQPYDNYLAERWYLRDQLNLEAEILAQLDALRLNKPYREGEATAQARLDYAAERLRLLYVGITRARRHLMITWNVGRYWNQGGDKVNRPALALVALKQHLEDA